MDHGFYVYILKCADDSYYVGHTAEIEQRLDLHLLSKISYVAQRLPFLIVYQNIYATRTEAFVVERQLKGWSRAKKAALIAGDFDKLKQLSKKKSCG